MDKLPVLFVQRRDISSVNAGTSVSARGVTENGVVCRDLYVEYIPARRCRTCRFREVADNGCNHLLGMRSIPPDGSGFCHNYEERI